MNNSYKCRFQHSDSGVGCFTFLMIFFTFIHSCSMSDDIEDIKKGLKSQKILTKNKGEKHE